MSRKSIDISGEKYGRVTVVKFLRLENHKSYFECRCDCGKVFITTSNGLRSGNTKSCGCFAAERFKAAPSKHMSSYKSEYSIWRQMKGRCHNPRNSQYKHYGARGISVCERWKNDFLSFYNDMGTRPSPKHSVDRIDYNGNYEPNNCRWATWDIQANNMRSNVLITHDGKTLNVSQWAKVTGIKDVTLRGRLKKFPASIALTIPVRSKSIKKIKS